MRRLQPFWFFLLGVLAIDASAQDESRHTSTPTCLQLFCDAGRRDSAPAFNDRLEVLLRLMPPPKPLPPQYTYAFEKYHGRFHNDFLHPFVVTAVTSQYDQHSTFFKHWNSSRSGFDLIQFGAGRFGIGVETQRILITESDRRSSNPLFTPDNCYASGFQSASACYAPSFREGDRRYGVALRIYLDRPK